MSNEENETDNENGDRARSLVFAKREVALRNAGQFEFHCSLQFAQDKPRPDSRVVSFEPLQNAVLFHTLALQL